MKRNLKRKPSNVSLTYFHETNKFSSTKKWDPRFHFSFVTSIYKAYVEVVELLEQLKNNIFAFIQMNLTRFLRTIKEATMH